MSQKGFKLGFDKIEQRVVHIDEVPEGFDQAVCPDCKSPLIASNRHRESRQKDTYFRHRTDSNCNGMSLVHLWAQQILVDRKTVLGDGYQAKATAKDTARNLHTIELARSAEILYFINPMKEIRLDADEEFRVADVCSVYADTRNDFAIEVYVSNKVDRAKEEFFHEKQIDCLEIDLSGTPLQMLNRSADFEDYVLKDAPRRWVHCSRYSDLDKQAVAEVKLKANRESRMINDRRANKKSAKEIWRVQNDEFVRLVEAFNDPNNQEYVEQLYKSHLHIEGTLSNQYFEWFLTQFGGIPEIINIPVKGELGFKCHRSIWQWEVYQRAVLYSFYKSNERANKPIKMTRATRGYENAARLFAWYDNAYTWTAEELYQSVKKVIPLNKISSEAEVIAGGPLLREKGKPEEFSGLKVKEWTELPKPVCTIRRYIKKLMKEGVLEVFSGDTYMVPENAKLPISYEVTHLEI